jgi:glycosyltransferase involved in cell wall biosynthesis
VLAQDFTDFGAIVVVDGSTDSTVTNLSTSSGPRLREVLREPGGPCLARNAGAAVATGEWLVFVDDDDRVAPHWLAVLDEHGHDPEVGAVSCETLLVGHDGGGLEVAPPRRFGPPYGGVEAQFLASTVAVRKELFDAAGGCDPLMKLGENLELGIRLVMVCEQRGMKIVVDRRTPVRWTQRPGGRPSNQNAAVYEAAVHILEKHSDRLRSDDDALAAALSVAGVNAARPGIMRGARRKLAGAVRLALVRYRAGCDSPSCFPHAWPGTCGVAVSGP